MRTGPNPNRVDAMRLKFYRAISADIVQTITDLGSQLEAEHGELLARVARGHMAIGAQIAAELFDRTEDFEEMLSAALAPFSIRTEDEAALSALPVHKHLGTLRSAVSHG